MKKRLLEHQKVSAFRPRLTDYLLKERNGPMRYDTVLQLPPYIILSLEQILFEWIYNNKGGISQTQVALVICYKDPSKQRTGTNTGSSKEVRTTNQTKIVPVDEDIIMEFVKMRTNNNCKDIKT